MRFVVLWFDSKDIQLQQFDDLDQAKEFMNHLKSLNEVRFAVLLNNVIDCFVR